MEKRKRGRPRNNTEQARAATDKQRDYIAQYEAANYDKVLIRFPKGTKEKILETGSTINGFTVRAVLKALEDLQGTSSDSD